MEYNVNKNVLMYGIKMIIVIKYVFHLVIYKNYHQKIFKQINVIHKNNVVNIIMYYNKILIYYVYIHNNINLVNNLVQILINK